MRRARFQALFVCLAAAVAGRAQSSPQGVHQADLQKVLASDGLAGDEFGSSAAMHGVTAVVGAPLHDHAGLTDCGGAYVYVFDGTSWSEQAELVAADAASLDQFGVSVDVDNDTIVVGAWKDTNQNGPSAGSAYVFVRSGTSWSQEAKLVASDGAPDDELGRSVAVWGDRLLVGAHHADAPGADSGSAYAFARSGASWSELQKLVARDGAAGDEFGSALSLDADLAVIGAPLDNTLSGMDSGSAYVFVRSGTSWVFEWKLRDDYGAADDHLGRSVAVSGVRIVTGSPGAFDQGVSGLGSGRAYAWARSGTSWSLEADLAPLEGSELGASVALDGDTALAGAQLDDLTASNAGAVEAFRKEGTDWIRLGTLTAGDAGMGDQYGSSIALARERVLVGARLDDDAGTDAGSAYFLRMVPLPTFRNETKLVAPDGAASDNFGTSTAVDGDTALIGAYEDDTVGGPDCGSAYVFVRSGTTWTFESKPRAADGAPDDNFGVSVAISGDTAVVGAYTDDDAGADSGSAYVFARSGTSWNQEAKLAATDGAAGDNFGVSVAISGDTAVVGAFGAGSAYVFVRSGTSWSQQAKLVASDGAFAHNFGASVAIDGDTAVVGAFGAFGAGRAYVFVRSGTSWSQQARLIATDGAAADRFGNSVAIHGETAVVGAYQDDDAGGDSGSAYVFTRSGTSWSQQAKLVAADGASHANFGFDVAISDDTAVVGARWDNDAGGSSGSAYVFTRFGTSWSQRSKLVASDGAVSDFFGTSVAIHGDTAVVGATGDDDAGADSGSAYVFVFAPFPSFCDGADGSHAACPCGNVGNPDAGCDIQQGTGGVRLDVTAQQYVPQNRATLVGTGYPPASQPPAIVIRASSLDAVTPVAFGDGVRCIGTPIVRLSAQAAVAGTSVHPIGHGAMGGTFYYQLWFRNHPVMFCTPDAFNLSNGRALAW